MRRKTPPSNLEIATYDQAVTALADGFDGIMILVQGAMSRDGESQVETDLILDMTESDKLVNVHFDKPIPAPAGRIHGMRLSAEDATKIVRTCQSYDHVMLVGTDRDSRTAGIAAGLQRAGIATPDKDPYDMHVMPDRTAHDAICLVSGLRARLDAAKHASGDFERAQQNLFDHERRPSEEELRATEARRERIRQLADHPTPQWQPRDTSPTDQRTPDMN